MPGSRFAHAKAEGEHKVHDTQVKRLRHPNFFQHECYLEVRVPRVKLPEGKVALVEPDWVGKLAGFTLLFEALVLMLAQATPPLRDPISQAPPFAPLGKPRAVEQLTSLDWMLEASSGYNRAKYWKERCNCCKIGLTFWTSSKRTRLSRAVHAANSAFPL